MPQQYDDAALVRALVNGEPEAPGVLFDRYGEVVQRVLARTLGFRHPDRGDLLHDVFVSALEGIKTLKNPVALKSWLIGMTVFSAQAALRRIRRNGPTEAPELAEQQEAPTASPEVVEAVRALYAVMDKLADEDRVVFILRYVEDMTLEEVAEACRFSFSTARRRISRAEERFRGLLPDYPALSERIRESGR
jgi:RNA polymerase sigma-70 factor (ECF subfamily)